MKPLMFMSTVMLVFILSSCNSEYKAIKGVWTNETKPESYTMYGFNRDGTYLGLYYQLDSTKGKADMVLKAGSVGYYEYTGPHEFNLYEVNVDLTPILGKSVTKPTIGLYLDNFMSSQTKPDLENIKPSFAVQIQSDGEHLYIVQNKEIVVILKRRHTEFGDKT